MASKLAIILTLLSIVTGQDDKQFPTVQRMDLWAKTLDDRVKMLVTGETDLTKATQYSKAYQDAFDAGVGYTLERPNGRKILESMVKKVTDIFDKNLEALRDLQNTAEEAVSKYEYNDNLSLRKVNFTNVNEMEDLANLTKYSEHFKQHVYLETSGVHVPIEIYEGYNAMQMTKVCHTCTPVCDLCKNNLYWRRDSALGITDAPLVKDPNILNTIAWTQALDETFKANAARFPGIYWQSFGSQEGVLRMYPASQWLTVDNLPDLYDVRRRPWYIHGTSSPKDVIILLDTSGSMHGQSFDIMKIAAKTLLNTLGENDYVNVAAFAKEVKWVTPCLGEGLVQANTRNKRLLFDGIDLLADRHIASFTDALDFAYRNLEEFEGMRDPQDGADCHKLIMIFSDGGTENPSKILKVYTNSSRGITSEARIFTYAVGPHPLPTVALKDMACATGGAFTTITAMGAIRTKVQNSYVPIITRPPTDDLRPVGFSSVYLNAADYIRILNRPLVLSSSDERVEPTFFSRDHLGLGFITTVTMPVFNTSALSDNQTLAGVVGIDIPISNFEALTPQSALGPLGYTFGVNSNGFLLFHPKMWALANYLEDPSHNDLEDLEGDVEEIKALRMAMVDMAATGNPAQIQKMRVNTSVILNLGHSLQIEVDYFFAPVDDKAFAISAVVPVNWNYVSVPEQSDTRDVLAGLLKDNFLRLAPRKFCDETKADEDANPGETLEQIHERFVKDSCHGRDLNHLIWDLKVLSSAFANKNPSGFHFAIADGGAIFLDGLNKDNEDMFHLDPYKSSLYKSALLSPTPIIYVEKHADRQVIPIYIHDPQEEPIEDEASGDDLIVSDGEDLSSTTSTTTTTTLPPNIVMQMQPPSLYLASSVRVSDGQGASTVVGVSGIELQNSFLLELLYNATTEVDGQIDCRQSDLACYIIDTSGYVLASNQEDEAQVGDFFGVADPQLMSHFLERDFFHSRDEYNYQALCPTEVRCDKESSSVRLIPTATRAFVFNILDTALGLLQQFSSSLSGLILSSLATGVESSVNEYTKQVTEGLHRCTTRTQHLEWVGESPYHNRINVTCRGVHCTREVHSYKLRHLNAILVVSDPPQWCQSCRRPLIFDGPLEVGASNETCVLPKRYRRRPEECFATHEDEVDECRSNSPALVSLSSLLLLVAMIFRPCILY